MSQKFPHLNAQIFCHSKIYETNRSIPRGSSCGVTGGGCRWWGRMRAAASSFWLWIFCWICLWDCDCRWWWRSRHWGINSIGCCSLGRLSGSHSCVLRWRYPYSSNHHDLRPLWAAAVVDCGAWSSHMQPVLLKPGKFDMQPAVQATMNLR